MSGSFGGRDGRPWKESIVAGLVFLALSAAAAPAQEEDRETGWFDEAELSLVATDGNSQSETFSLRNTLTRIWEKAEFKLAAGGLRAETTDLTRSAVGTSLADATLVESSTTAVTAERYLLDARYEYRVSNRRYWYGALRWDRDEPAGIQNRSSGAAGVGSSWLDNEKSRWHTDYGLTYTIQEDVVEPAGAGDGFLGFRLSSDYWRQLTATSKFSNQTVVDQNLDESSDLRAHMVNALSVRISDRLALKVSQEVQFDKSPALVAVPIFTPAGEPVGEELFVEADEVDTTLSLALVVTL
jgi:putative salt-induced outer membrane protein YdiY